MHKVEIFLVTLQIMVFTSCQYDDQHNSTSNGNNSNINSTSTGTADDLSKVKGIPSICDDVPPYNPGGCVYWWPPSLDFGVVTLGQSKTLNITIKTHPGIVDHYVEFICQYGFPYSDEYYLSGDIPDGHVPGDRIYKMTLTFTPIHGTGIRTGSLWLQYYQWSPGGTQRWADELEITARVLNGGLGGGVIR